MNPYLILVKHSLPEIVDHLPARDWHLSAEGRLRAERLAKRLIAYQPEILIASVEPKAIETAQIVAKELKLEFDTVEGLHEHDRSKTSYLSRDAFQKAVEEFFRRPNQLVFGSETANEAHARFSQAVHSILEVYLNKTIAIVSHGTVISLFVSRLAGISDVSLWNELGLPSFILLDRNSNRPITQENII